MLDIGASKTTRKLNALSTCTTSIGVLEDCAEDLFGVSNSIEIAKVAVRTRGWSTAGDQETASVYLRKILDEDLPVLQLPKYTFDHKPGFGLEKDQIPASSGNINPALRERGLMVAELPAETIAEWEKMVKEASLDSFSCLLSCFFGILHRYTGQGELTVGIPVYNGELAARILPVKVDVSQAEAFGRLVQLVRGALAAAYSISFTGDLNSRNIDALFSFQSCDYHDSSGTGQSLLLGLTTP